MKTNALLKGLYPSVAICMKKNESSYKKCVGRFINSRSKELYETAPYDRIFFTNDDYKDFIDSTKINEETIHNSLRQTYYHSIAAFNPRAAKDPFTVAMIMVIRYFYLARKEKDLELSMIYLAFSGKFYPSIHYSSFPTVCPSEYRHVMDYVVNNMLNERFDLKSQGSVFGAIRSICNTWIKTYGNKIKSCSDEDVVYLIQQLHSRIKSFMQNIAELYYKVYNDKNAYMTFDSDSLDDDSYRLADNDALKCERVVENTMSRLSSTEIDYRLCKMASDNNVHIDEVKSILQSILNDNNRQPEVKEFVRLMVSSYFEQSKTKDVRDIDFLTYSIAPKPNSKDKNIIRQKEIIESWLCETSPAYRKRRSRLATKNSYYRSIYTYFALSIHEANK